MSTRVVENTLKAPDGSALVGESVWCWLVIPGFTPTDKTQISARSYALTDGGGHYSFALRPQSEIDPEGTYYVIRHPGAELHAFVLPSGAGPFWLRDILVAAPESPGVITVGGVSLDQVDDAIDAALAGAAFVPLANITVDPDDGSLMWSV